jgi:hypothetical protein
MTTGTAAVLSAELVAASIIGHLDRTIVKTRTIAMPDGMVLVALLPRVERVREIHALQTVRQEVPVHEKPFRAEASRAMRILMRLEAVAQAH